jgi:thiosulfate reductase cytochrome b subunit
VKQQKHALWIRWTHWINFPVLALMVWSGILIYWANDVYRPFFPDFIYGFFHIDHRLAEGMAIHFVLMWLFLVNGVAYVSYLLISGEWREIVPHPRSFRDAILVTLHDLKIIKNAPPQGKFNAAQKIAYFGITVIGIFLILTGLAIYKPVQLHWLTSLFGGYDTARLIHFILMLSVVAFFVVHILQVIRAGFGNFSSMIAGWEVSSRNWKQAWFSLSVAFVFIVFASGAWVWVTHEGPLDELAKPLRYGLELNGKLWGSYLDPKRVAPIPPPPPVGRTPRFNGDIGLNSEMNSEKWRLHLIAHQEPGGDPDETDTKAETTLSLKEIKQLPRTETSTIFKCIEGWSTDISYAGVRFSEFINMYHLGKKSDGSYYRYVALVTPDEEYYVSIDMKSMLQPQVVLAYEMDGKPLLPQNGAPLRLIIPNKYGIKSLKRVGTIYFADRRPPDYWEEQGYDWFAGL